ncbi:MAG: hypothetical protein ACK5M0_05410 [Bacteroidales bacterium]
MTQEEQKKFLGRFQKGQVMTLVYNKKRIAGIYKGYVEDGDDIHITLQHKENGIGWSYPCKGLKQIEYIK